ncbi:hypothetical protein [Peribacillus sp. SCS-37]|uniref:hypothetical protein n=1 Tax=Paraperibacillus esterisolvens TaxID=3115296 RepID=UPI003906B04B
MNKKVDFRFRLSVGAGQALSLLGFAAFITGSSKVSQLARAKSTFLIIEFST